MKEIMIKLTPEQELWLTHFADHHKEGSEENLGTCKPLHLVQTRDVTCINDGGESGEKIYFDFENNQEYENVTDIVRGRGIKDVSDYDEAYLEKINDVYVMDEESYLKAYGVGCVLTQSRVYSWRTVSYHFTLQSAKEYIEYQRHNLNKPRTFTVSPGYGHNGDYEPIFDFLMEVGTNLLKGSRWTNEAR